MPQTVTQPPGTTAPADGVRPGAYLMLALATAGFAVNFWAWALLSPLSIRLKGELDLTSFQQALMVAVPVVVGSIGRIPVGILTDRFGGRVMFPVVSFLTIVPVLFLGLAGHSSYVAVLIGGFFLGLGGTAFAVGVPFVNAWFPPGRRGFAIGVFGAGMGGTAISALTTVKLANAHGVSSPFLLTAVVLAVYGVVAALVLRDAPGHQPSSGSALRRLAETARLRVTWQLSLLYAVAFGCYVALSVYLPTYLKTAYDLTQTDAANKMAGFVLVAVVLRPIGGWLCDRFDPTTVLAVCFGVVTICALGQSTTPGLYPYGTVAFLSTAAAVGAGSGAVFALVARRAPADRVGGVTGVVGAAGGLGGFIPPLLMGSLYGSTGSYAIGLLLLSVTALASLVFTLTVVRASRA
ncbi:MAG: NarK/NasA family nitrate transporter [Frankiaceae bacterium]|nr:NarK/NasA family nitrate transporter [Frankiaceae bacterium]